MHQNNSPQDLTRARTFFLILFLVLILFFHENSIIQTILVLLGIGVFEPIFNPLLRYLEALIAWLGSLCRSILSNHLPALGRWLMRHRRLITTVTSLMAIVILLGATTLQTYLKEGFGRFNDFICLQKSLPSPTCSSGYGISTLSNGVRIGLIGDNAYGQFDQSQFNQGESFVEGLIFGENKQACAGQHMTLIATTTLSRTVEDPASGATLGLQNLYGYYLWQHFYNATHPSIRLCLAIANLGTSDTANQHSALVQTCPKCYSMPQIIYQMAQLAHTDPHVRGIVGFPYSQQAKEALDIIQKYPSLASLPIISPTASSDNLSNTSNFYRVDALDQSQGEALAQYFCHYLAPGPGHPPASVALFRDNTDFYSGDIPLDFQDSISKDCPNKVKIVPGFISYRNGDRSSIQKAVQEAVSKPDNANYIFFPGYDADLDVVESTLRDVLPKTFNTVTLLGGDGLNNVDVTTHYAYNPVYAASFAQPRPLSDPVIQEFKNKSENIFHLHYFVNSSSLWIPKDTLLAVDAVHAFTQALHDLNQTDASQEAFNTALQSISFTGESGQIVFQGNRITHNHISDRNQEMVYITCYDTTQTLNLVDAYTTHTDNGTTLETPPPFSASHC